eukprot:m.747620 g.747620  ORF g.747620 m.747620 type:complete len:448 (-) comp58964_c0_seq2:107-1450(-)
MATAYLAGLTAGGGVPLFLRASAGMPQLSFPTIGTLYGTNMFVERNDAQLKSTVTENAKIVWRTYHSSIIMIMITANDGAVDAHIERIMDLYFNAMMLVVGYQNLIKPSFVDRLKRDLKGAYGFIDSLLNDVNFFGVQTSTTEVSVIVERDMFQSCVDNFAEELQSHYVCLLINGLATVATDSWWELPAEELILLPAFVRSLPLCHSRDIPIFLPKTSPDQPFRLVSCLLLEGVEVVALCGPEPSLAEITSEIVAPHWERAYAKLSALSQSTKTEVPTTLDVDPSILAFMYIDRSTFKSLSCAFPEHDISEGREEPAGDISKAAGTIETTAATTTSSSTLVPSLATPSSQRPKHALLGVLNAWARTLVGSSCGYPFPTLVDDENAENADEAAKQHTMSEAYMCSALHKCYSIRRESVEVYVLLRPTVPTFALRTYSTHLFEKLQRLF